MKIEAITLHEIRMPLVHFFETSFGRTYEREILLVCLHTDGGNAWGECVAGENPYNSDGWIGSAWATLISCRGPAVMRKSFTRASACGHLMSKVRGHRMAK